MSTINCVQPCLFIQEESSMLLSAEDCISLRGRGVTRVQFEEYVQRFITNNQSLITSYGGNGEAETSPEISQFVTGEFCTVLKVSSINSIKQ